MPGSFQDLVRMVTTTTGTGAVTLSAAAGGFRTAAEAGFVSGEDIPYTMLEVDAGGNPSGGYEIGLGRLGASAGTLTRHHIFTSSNSGAAVNWAAGTRHVILGVSADVLPRGYTVNDCRLSANTEWCPGGDVASTSTIRLLPGPKGGQIGLPAFAPNLGVASKLFVACHVGASGVSVAVPSASLTTTKAGVTVASGNNVVTYPSGTAVPAGTLVTGTGIPDGTHVVSSTTTQAVLTRAATASNMGVTLSFYSPGFDLFARCGQTNGFGNRDATTGMLSVHLYANTGSVWTAWQTRPALTTASPEGLLTDSVGGLYLGTAFYWTPTTVCDTAARRWLWNYYNQLPRKVFIQDSAGQYNYTTASYRVANGDLGNTLSVLTGYVTGFQPASLDVLAHQLVTSTSGATLGAGIGLDGSNPTVANSVSVGAGGTAYQVMGAYNRYADNPGIGLRRLLLMEFGGLGGAFLGGVSGGNKLTGNFLC